MSTPPTFPEPGTFQAWPKVARLNRDIIVTEKIDGTNAAVCISEEGHVWAQSRTKVITPEADNAGFAAWVEENKDALLYLGPGRHFGEWWGQKVQRTYGLDRKVFSLFNTTRWGGADSGRPPCCEVVPILYEGPFSEDAIKSCLNVLLLGSKAAPGFDRPEGIVVFHVAANQLFKVTIEGDERPKGAPEGVQE